MFRQMDDNIVKIMITTVHNEDENKYVERPQKKPRINETNNTYIKIVQGKDHTKTIAISQIIDNYNHWVIGTDLTDKICC